MGLIIRRNNGEAYYLFFTEELELGEYIKITKVKKYGNIKEYVEAPQSIQILREELVEKDAKQDRSLEEFIREIKLNKLNNNWGLSITRKPGESYYLFVKEMVLPEEYIRIEARTENKVVIDAPQEILILREELVNKKGGLENIVKQIRERKP